MGFILQDITPWNHKNVGNVYFGRGGRVLWNQCGPGNQCGTHWLFLILWISESFSLYLLVKNSLNFKLGFFIYFQYISGDIIRKNILCSDYHSARWYWCKKDQKNIPQTSHKIFPNASLWILHCYEHLWFKTYVKIHFQGVKVEKNGIPVIKISFYARNPPKITGFHELTPKLLSIIAGLIYHSCGL